MDSTSSRSAQRRRRPVVVALAAVLLLAVFVGPAGGGSRANDTVTVDTLPISNGLPLDLGIAEGLLRQAGDHDQEDHAAER